MTENRLLGLKALILMLSGSFLIAACNREQDPPNVILMLADDMGYSDISSFGGEVPTPNIDRLAKEGVTFTQFYNGAQCCPKWHFDYINW